MSADRHRTLDGEGRGQLRERASRFIAIAFPMRSEDDFSLRMEAYMKEHRGARHFCYAWVLADDGVRRRANDAGEPAGTAGRPILARIQAAGLTWCGVIVVRWFGGTLLGKGGLVRAYGEAAQLAIADAPQVERLACDMLRLRCGYALVEQARATVIAHGGMVEDGTFEENCELLVRVPCSQVADLRADLALRGIDITDQEAK